VSIVRTNYKHTITCHTDDLAVVHCLRALSQWAQQSGNCHIPWGGTKKPDWERDGNCVTFRFTESLYRDAFRQKANELLYGRWCEKGTSDQIAGD
jgi:hypothetical protein